MTDSPLNCFFRKLALHCPPSRPKASKTILCPPKKQKTITLKQLLKKKPLPLTFTTEGYSWNITTKKSKLLLICGKTPGNKVKKSKLELGKQPTNNQSIYYSNNIYPAPVQSPPT